MASLASPPARSAVLHFKDGSSTVVPRPGGHAMWPPTLSFVCPLADPHAGSVTSRPAVRRHEFRLRSVETDAHAHYDER